MYVEEAQGGAIQGIAREKRSERLKGRLPKLGGGGLILGGLFLAADLVTTGGLLSASAMAASAATAAATGAGATAAVGGVMVNRGGARKDQARTSANNATTELQAMAAQVSKGVEELNAGVSLLDVIMQQLAGDFEAWAKVVDEPLGRDMAAEYRSKADPIGFEAGVRAMWREMELGSLKQR
ncbi:hypothetical protein PLESTB_000634500 [Pleodorina starrii]|uniref:Uncharacterized protein n=1 Tax=Pleodorina starrii TaxID=330485 RepID=A0A9W6F0T4_9CHLO|nr:hypothetical protein PLESTB_000634500 [Pleodorina starrii]GLC71486.1 hypothetical protein PLESTF_001126900 [Pleodorina starrii]